MRGEVSTKRPASWPIPATDKSGSSAEPLVAADDPALLQHANGVELRLTVGRRGGSRRLRVRAILAPHVRGPSRGANRRAGWQTRAAWQGPWHERRAGQTGNVAPAALLWRPRSSFFSWCAAFSKRAELGAEAPEATSAAPEATDAPPSTVQQRPAKTDRCAPAECKGEGACAGIPVHGWAWNGRGLHGADAQRVSRRRT